MSEAEEESPESQLHENQCGVILGYWDHEKTPTLIQELETSVSLIEEKCKKLLEELIYYKKYLEESGEFSSHFFGSETQINIPESLCRSEPDIVFRKNFINSQETRQIFEDKFQQKLSCINQELTEVAQKIGLKNNIVLFPTNDYLKTLNAEIENEAEKSWCDNRDNFINVHFLKPEAKPDSVIELGREVDFSKITKNELDLYLKLSRLNMKRTKCRIRSWQGASPKGRKVKVGARWKIRRFCQNLQKSTFEYSKSKSKTKRFKKRSGVTVTRTGMQLSRGNFPATIRSGGKLNGWENEAIWDLQGELSDSSVGRGLKEEESGAVLGMQPGSRAHEVDSNVTQLLRLRRPKAGVRVSASENLGGKAVRRGILKVRSDADAGRGSSSGGSGHLRQRLLDTKGDFWAATGHVSPTFGKVQSAYNCSWPESFPEERRKPNMRRCNDGRRCIKTRSKRAQAPGSKITTSEIQRADILGFGKNDAAFEKASGDGICKGGHPKPRKQRSEACAYRSDRCPKRTLISSDFAFAPNELKSLEDKVDSSLDRYEKLLQFYSKFLCSNKSLGPLTYAREVTNNGFARRKGGYRLSPISPLIQ